MTRATICMRTPVEGRVEIKGHAGNALICAAISTLAGAALNVLGEAAENVVYESGDVRFDVRLTDGIQMGALDVLIEGLSMLEERFSDRVGVTLIRPE